MSRLSMPQVLTPIKNLLRRIRVSQPFNWVITTLVRALVRSTGIKCDRLILHLPRAGTVAARLPNGRVLRLWSRADDWTASQVFWHGWDNWEKDIAPLLYQLAAHSRVTIDVGAHVGFYSILAAHANPTGQVFAFEPLPMAYDRLELNVRLNGLANVQCRQWALGDVAGSADFFYVAGGDIPSSSGLSFDFMRQAQSLTKISVPVLTLDHFLQEHYTGPVDLVKMDTETTEVLVLRGMTATLAQHHPDIICEVLEGYHLEQELERLLLPYGYHFYLMTDAGLVREKNINAHTKWRNHLFTTVDERELRQKLRTFPLLPSEG